MDINQPTPLGVTRRVRWGFSILYSVFSILYSVQGRPSPLLRIENSWFRLKIHDFHVPEPEILKSRRSETGNLEIRSSGAGNIDQGVGGMGVSPLNYVPSCHLFNPKSYYRDSRLLSMWCGSRLDSMRPKSSKLTVCTQNCRNWPSEPKIIEIDGLHPNSWLSSNQ